jgi:enoyl-CoA hydratase/carnithine racemase
MARETIRTRHEDGILVVTFDRPGRKNAFNHQMWCELRDVMAEAHEDDAVRVVVMTGAGSAFTAGADLAEMAAPAADNIGEHGFSSCLDRFAAFDKPLVAAVNGVGVGAGLTLLLYFDYVYIARGARLRAPFVTLGVAPEAGSSYLLPAILGHRKALQLLYESDFIDAERACELGIATELCEPDGLMPAALERARWLSRKPLGSLRWTKRLLLASREDALRAARTREDQAFARRIGSPENVEAIRAFFEKREADFSSVPPTDHERRD